MITKLFYVSERTNVLTESFFLLTKIDFLNKFLKLTVVVFNYLQGPSKCAEGKAIHF